MTTIYVDADGCPVKEEIYRVAKRHLVPVILVANTWMRLPDLSLVRLQQVGDGFDEADDWIVENARAGDVAVTTDIPLAARLIEKDVRVVGPRGREFKEDQIGNALATREVLSHLRDMGEVTGGPPPMRPKDRSKFLSAFHEIVEQELRKKRKG
ncbi:MAG: YaiI/YqxD family protein [Planctomycetota bacterium]